jgi:hypothetical protein
VIARWAAVEKQLDTIHAILAKGDKRAVAAFYDLRGWDRKFKAIKQAADTLPEETSDLVRAVIGLAKAPAAKRDELAHGIWAVVKGAEDHLALLPPGTPTHVGQTFAEAAQAGTSKIPVANAEILEQGCLVSADDLDALIQELDRSRIQLDALMYGHLLPAHLDATGREFANYRQAIANDREVASRVSNMVRTRAKTESKPASA